jgi:hypothetical protein
MLFPVRRVLEEWQHDALIVRDTHSVRILAPAVIFWNSDGEEIPSRFPRDRTDAIQNYPNDGLDRADSIDANPFANFL